MLLFGYFNGLRADDHFLFHFLQSANQLLLLGLCFFLGFLPFPNFVQNPVLLLSLQIRLILNLLLILLSLQLDFILLLLQLAFKLRHLFFIFDVHDLFDDVANDALLFIKSLEISTLIKQSQLLLQFRDFILVFSQ